MFCLRVGVSLTLKEGKFLAFLYRKQVEEDTRMTTTMLARSFEVKPATATETLQKLANKRMIDYTRYYGAKLTSKGIIEARKLLRKHRLLEILLVRFLKYDAAKACEEASKIDHYCSIDLVNAICRAYSHPSTCPCDKQIFRDETCMGG